MRARLLLLSLLILPALPTQGQHNFKILHAFGLGQDGGGVWSSVTLDNAGKVYGTTSGGGAYKVGTVFRLTPGSDGRWKEAILHSFGGGNDGAGPFAGVIFDAMGNLYGPTETGGGGYTYGTVYRLSPGSNGWRETVLHRFGRRDQDGSPYGNLVMDERRNLYGTAASAAFELSPGPKGWTETILHQFTGKNGDGQGPFAGPIRDAAGNLYGTTLGGGNDKDCGGGCGTVWELSPPAQGADAQGWTEHIPHRFSGREAYPGVGQLAMDHDGNLYGAVQGGKYLAGVIYKLSPVSATSSTGETWQETVLYNFTGRSDGGYPEGVILDTAGNLYGICGVGGAYGEGTVFELSPQRDGTWQYTLLHTFTGQDGAEPVANPTLGPDGKLYGTAATGGPHGGGVVFEITP
jgi:uncharacterized repeat protein (TIGR03803 family)